MGSCVDSVAGADCAGSVGVATDSEGAVEAFVGACVGSVGVVTSAVGSVCTDGCVTFRVGAKADGAVGACVGAAVGAFVAGTVGALVGAAVGAWVGAVVGLGAGWDVCVSLGILSCFVPAQTVQV